MWFKQIDTDINVCTNISYYKVKLASHGMWFKTILDYWSSVLHLYSEKHVFHHVTFEEINRPKLGVVVIA